MLYREGGGVFSAVFTTLYRHLQSIAEVLLYQMNTYSQTFQPPLGPLYQMYCERLIKVITDLIDWGDDRIEGDDWSECFWSVMIQACGWALLGKGDDGCGLGGRREQCCG